MLRKGNQNAPSWYEAQDLKVLKAWSNEIVEIQPEIFMFGSLKTVDLHNNKLTALPETFPDLTALTILDLSHNALQSLPVNLFALPNLTTLNISHNGLTSLPFRSPFAASGANPLARTRDPRGGWFGQSITRATSPLPRLISLDASYNYITARAIDHGADSLPVTLSKLDLSGNPLGASLLLIRALARLGRLRELLFQHADIADDSFPPDLFSALQTTSPFLALKLLDLEESHVTRPGIEAAFVRPIVKQELEFETTNEEPPEGVLRVIVGKKVIKEAWEVEAERRAKLRTLRQAGGVVEEGLGIGRSVYARSVQAAANANEVAKDAWELEADQGLLTEGARRRARAAATQASSSSTVPVPAAPRTPQKKPVVEKEAWEIEAEQGMLTAGAQRRARAAATLSISKLANPAQNASTTISTAGPAPSPSPTSVASVLSNPQFYHAVTQTLTLPPSAPPSKAPHARSISLASPSWATSKASSGSASELALAIPTPTLPLTVIATQPFAQTLKVLVLTNRRKDTSFSLPSAEGASLPRLEELILEGCNLSDSVSVMHPSSMVEGGDRFSAPRVSEPLVPLITKLFPSLRTLDLSYNTISSSALGRDALSSLILASEAAPDGPRTGLRHCRLRGNRITELDGFQGIAELFGRNRDVPEWKLEELDLRDNEIGKLPPGLGLLPLDVFLVDGNVYVIFTYLSSILIIERLCVQQFSRSCETSVGKGRYEGPIELVEGENRVNDRNGGPVPKLRTAYHRTIQS
ncbi:hypothetical protein BKA93DRAFT_93932 [Sparassis latifolia]